MKRAQTLLWWVLGAALLAFAFGMQGLYARFPRGWLTDDSYFYLQIARNIARLGFPPSTEFIRPTGISWLRLQLAGVSWLAGLLSWDSRWQLGVMVGFFLLLVLTRSGVLPQARLILFTSSVFKSRETI